ncbi:ATP-binding protein [Bacillus cereus group sp. BfR-BA-01315]|uniref:ATP-binding protein n=1 Tax=Bacillus cereus group sp. BfR-BA-01315 TaxID=2920292 RepID=UPI001F5A146E|nr:ATP-binding protein [Bacillus cereus group sp. BfR-BA-01315]
MARSKFDKELENMLEKNWKSLLVLGAVGFVWYSKEKILAELMKRVPVAIDVTVSICRLILLGILIYTMIRIVLHYLYVYFEKKRYQYVMFIPHIDDDVTAEKLGQMIRHVHNTGRKPLERLWKGREWYRMIMFRPEGTKERVRFYIGGPKDELKRVVQAMRSVYEHAEVYGVSRNEVPFPSKKAVGGRMVLKRKRAATLSLARYKKDLLPMLGNAMEEKTWVDIAFSPDNGYHLTKGIRKAEKALKKKKKHELDTFEKEEIRALNKRFSNNEVAFQVSVSFASEHYPGVPVIKNIGHMVASIMADVNELRYRRLKRCMPTVPNPIYGKMVWTSSELLNVFHLPDMTGDKEKKAEQRILYLDKGEAMLPNDMLAEGIAIGHVMHPYIKDRVVRIKEKYLSNHGYITGKVGKGKSSLVMALMQSRIDRWIENPDKEGGFSLFDPAQDLALVTMNRLLKAELDGKTVDWSKVHFIRFRDTKYPPALNLLHRFPDEEGDEVQAVVESIMEIIKTVIPGQAPQTERLLENIIGTLLSDTSRIHTILSVPLFITDEAFRRHVLNHVKGPQKQYYMNYWEFEVENALEDSKQAILNRLDMFRNTSYLKRMFGQTDCFLDIRKWMDQGHIVIFDVLGMGKKDLAVTGAYIANQYHRIAQKRPIGSKLHLMLIDEAHDFKIPILSKVVAKDRKHGLGLWILTQRVEGQLDPDLNEALREAGGNFFVCGQGMKSARILEGVMQNKFRADYLQGLPNLVAAIQTQEKLEGDTEERNVWCTVRIPPLNRYLPNGNVADYLKKEETQAANDWTKSKIAELEQHSGKSAEEIDKEIDEFLYTKAKYLTPKNETTKAPDGQEKQAPVNLEKESKVKLVVVGSNEERPARKKRKSMFDDW